MADEIQAGEERPSDSPSFPEETMVGIPIDRSWSIMALRLEFAWSQADWLE